MQLVDVSIDGVWVGDACIFEDDAVNSLNGGNRENGGVSNVDNSSRSNANPNIAVRLVLECTFMVKYKTYGAQKNQFPHKFTSSFVVC